MITWYIYTQPNLLDNTVSKPSFKSKQINIRFVHVVWGHSQQNAYFVEIVFSEMFGARCK